MRLTVMVSLCMMIFHMGAFAQKTTRAKEFHIDKSGLALQGYDPVAYFTQQKAIEGKKSIAYTHEGIRYQFSTEQHKKLFQSDPAKYEPEYGGWCAYAMGATGEKVEIDPETFTILNGKLYLFYHSWTNNTLPKWKKDESNLKKKADQNWKKYYSLP